ncbi:hypothetical protein Tco_1183722, partial [Tanacetum coccineum]
MSMLCVLALLSFLIILEPMRRLQTISVGKSSNMLMARLATRSAKPDGQCYLPLEKVDEFMEALSVPAGSVVPTGKDNSIVSTGSTKVIPAGST